MIKELDEKFGDNRPTDFDIKLSVKFEFKSYIKFWEAIDDNKFGNNIQI